MEKETSDLPEQDKNKKTNDKSDESTANAFDLLSETMQGAQTSFSSVYLTLQKTLEQNVQMAKTMNRVVQQMFQTNIKVSAKIESLQGRSRLIITIDNATAFPIIGMSGTLDFKPVDFGDTGVLKLDREHVDFIPEVPKLKLVSSSHYMATGQPTQSVDSLFLSPNDAAANSSTTTTTTTVLYPNTKHIEVLCINTSRLTRYNGFIDIQIPLPGDDGSTSVHLTNSFGVYLIDQMKKLVNADSKIQCTKDEQDDGFERNYSGQFIRDIFGINPVLGLEKGMRLCLEPTPSLYSGEDGLITCHIESISLDNGNIQVRFYGKNKNLVGLLVHELDSLNK